MEKPDEGISSGSPHLKVYLAAGHYSVSSLCRAGPEAERRMEATEGRHC